MANNIKVLVVDDSPVFLNYMSTALNGFDGIEVVATAQNADIAREFIWAAFFKGIKVDFGHDKYIATSDEMKARYGARDLEEVFIRAVKEREGSQ